MDKKEIVLLWDKSTPFERYLTNCGFDCKVVTPNVLAAPFLSRAKYKLIIVQAGFGNELYSSVLKELRANSVNIMEFVRRGGTLLVFGAFSDLNKNAYNWLPLSINYVIEERIVKIEVIKEHEAAEIVEKDKCMCDGYFSEIEGEIILTGNGAAILGVAEYGAGEIIATAIHEYPSPKFIEYCIV